MKNTGKGETSTIEQSKVDEPVEITNRNDLNKLKKMSNGDKLKVIPVTTPLYKNVKGYWTPQMDDKDSSKEIKLKKGDLVTYKGEYETFENAATNEKIVYLKVTTEKGKEGYVKLSTVELNSSNGKETSKVMQQGEKVNATAKANESEKTIGQAEEKYTIAIAAGRNNSDDRGITNDDKELREEELTIEVAEKVEKMLSEYTNIKVVQTGSTSKNPGGVKSSDRIGNAKSVNPNLCIQIYFGDGDKAGVETIYKQGDDISQQLAEILAKNLASSMGLTNLNAGADTEKCKDSEGNSASLNIIENAAVTGFPSVVAIGGNLNKEPDASVIEKDGVEKYAQAIINSIDEYFKADHTGRTATENDKTTYKDSTESRIINMKYVTPEKLQKYIDDGDFDNAIKSYTIDENRNLVIVTWSRNEDGSIELKTNNSMNLKTALKKYVMPYEYLLYFYMDTDYKGFVNDLADEVMNSEIVMAVEDNVTTTNTIETTQQKTSATVDKFNVGWHETNKKDTTVESVSTSVNVTYVSTWCVKAYQENSYSKAVLQLEDEEEKILNVPGKVAESTSHSATAENIIDSGVKKYFETEIDADRVPKQVEKEYSYNTYEQILTDTHTISNTYEKGEYKTEGRENVFIKLYNKHKMITRVRTSDYLFQILENNERTADLLDLTKYLIYKATNVPWGVLEFDFSIFDLQQFNEINSSNGSLDLLREYIRYFEGNTGLSPDGTKYKVGDDGAGHPTVGYGIDIYNSGFLDRFLAAGYDVSVGAYIDVDFVDALEMEEIQNALNTVDQKTSGLNLTIYQKHALVSRIYNCGSSGAFSARNGKTFVDAYNSYWNQDTDDEYQVAKNDGMYNHPLYQNYMKMPNTSGGSYLPRFGNKKKIRVDFI